MSFSPDSAQTRELNELRNHLKWFDEERRKSTRRVGELEQRLAQQGREMSDRERRIQELEWQLANLVERVDRIPLENSEITSHEKRIQDLEWHLADVNAQLLRLPGVDDELISFNNKLANFVEQQHEQQKQAETDLQHRLAAEQEATYFHIHQLEARLTDQARLEAELNVAQNANEELSRQVTELRELVARVDVDSRALATSFSQMEQQLIFQQAAANQSAEQLEEIRSSLSHVRFVEEDLAQIAAGVDKQLAQAASQVKQESSQIIQRLTAEFEDRLQTVSTRIDAIQETIPADVQQDLARIEQELENRQAQEIRLSSLLELQEQKLTPLNGRVEDLQRMLSSVDERAGRHAEAGEQLRVRLQEMDETVKPQIERLAERLEQAAERLEILSTNTAQLENQVKTLSNEQIEARSSVATLNKQISQSEKEVKYQLETWRTTLDEQKDTIDRFTQQWTVLSNQYKEARMAVQNFAHWQKQLEQQHREAQSTIDELFVKLQQDNRDLIWRVQAAQAEAIKKWPRLWLEEIQKAIEPNPERHLPAATSAPLQAEMSVTDALEQGLIKIDYEEELEQGLE
jgi:chromosome segregation ATPase